jgi:hypothetical protein
LRNDKLLARPRRRVRVIDVEVGVDAVAGLFAQLGLELTSRSIFFRQLGLELTSLG